ncbi:YdeI/OmpD-associated family protein [Aurantibacillus circumpalustris]|uniref:YdeI/OmpD-associated family protein n=1 Tax=Aurantibacillus circumpalustris TaxID=3036359 RepID=UPI00295BA1D1|nr:YdeI/OmpD-associated family protein [Aurantibacillus circumpalustris]
MVDKFKAEIELAGINPFVLIPDKILVKIFKKAGKDKGPIPIKGKINRVAYVQSLVRLKGVWRLYINASMLKNSPKRIGEFIEVMIEFDSTDRTIKPHPKFTKALKENKEAKAVFDGLRPSLQKEIIKYLSFLKTDKSINENVIKAIGFLLGKQRFIGRSKP